MDMEHLSAVCTGLGCVRVDEEGKEVYVKHLDCLVNLKNLQRFLRRDDPTSRDIFMQLGKWNTIRQDILPIIIFYRDQFDIVLNAVKVMVFLTMPVDPSSTNIPQQLEYLRNFKAAVLENDAIGVIVSHLQDPLEHMESGTLSDMDGKMFQLVLTLVRNLLAVDDAFSPLMRASMSSNAHGAYIKDELIEQLFKENVIDLLLALTPHLSGEQPFLRQDNLLILEIFNYLFSGQLPDIIASSGDKTQKKPSATYPALVDRDARRGRDSVGPRHSNFCGTFVRVEKDGTKTVLTRNPYQSPLDDLYQKPEIKRGLVRKVANDIPLQVPSNSSVCRLLKGLADQFLESSYNLLMQSVKDDIRSERNNVQSHDMVMFFAVANFFTGYQRCLLMKNKTSDCAEPSGENQHQIGDKEATFQGRCGCVASTMDEDMFILVTAKWQSFVESAKHDNDWFPPTSAGLLLKEMIHMLDYILKVADRNTSEGQKEVRVARILLYKVFYDQTENGILPFIFRLIKTFDVQKQPRSQLAGLIETTHIVLRLLESITKEDGALRVKKKARNINKKGANDVSKLSAQPSNIAEQDQDKSSSVAKNPDSLPQADKESDSSAVEILESNIANTVEDADVVPMIVSSSGEEAERGSEQRAMNLNVPSLEETLRNIDDTEGRLAVMHVEPAMNEGEEIEERIQRVTDEQVDEEVANESEEDDSEMDSEGEDVNTKEETLDVLKCVKMFADNTVLHNYCWLLKNYAHNTPATNYYIIRMLQRICQDCMMEPMLYQLSILQTCYEILSIRSISNSEQHQFAVAFLTKLVRHLFQKLKKSPMLFVDILFWKSKQDCHCISAEYMIHGLRKAANGKNKFTDRPVNVMDRRELLNSLRDDDEDDLDNAANEGGDANLNRNQSRDVGANFGDKGKVRRHKVTKKKGPFSDFQEDLIKELFEKHKESRSCSKLITQGLFDAGAVQDSGDPFTPAQVGRALKRLSLERVKKKTASNLAQHLGSDDDSGREDDGDGMNDVDGKSSDAEMADDGHNEEEAGAEPQPDIQDNNQVSGDIDILFNGKEAEIKKMFSARLGPKKRNRLLESLDEDSDKEDVRGSGGADGGDRTLEGSGKKSNKKSLEPKKRKSGDSNMIGGEDVPKRRRRSGLFSEEQDHELQSLFEKYKGMTRFKHLISHDLEGVFTPTQIGRRLQQLGCLQPRKRRSILAEMSDDQEETHQYKSSTHDGHRYETEKFSNDSEILGVSKMNIMPGSESGLKASWGSLARKNAQKKFEAGNIKPDSKNPDSTIPNEKMSELSQESGSDDDLPIAQHMSVKRIFGRRITRPEPEQEIRNKDGFEDKESRESDSDDDESIVHIMSTKEIFKRNEGVQQEQVEIVPGIVDIQDEQLVHKSPKKTYERKQKSQFDQEHMEENTWGDSDTDASDIDDMNVLGGLVKRPAKDDLALVLQEVQAFDLETKTKKRRLERKHTSNVGEVDEDSDRLVTSSSQQDPDSVHGGREAPKLHKAARKALLNAMDSDEDE